MDKLYIVVSYMNHYGGIETLVLRMLEWLETHNSNTVLITDEDEERAANAEILEEVKTIGTKIIKLPFRSYFDAKTVDNIGIQKFKVTEIVVFTYPEYFLAQQIKHRLKNKKIDIIFYVPHQYGLILEFNFRNPVLKGVSRILGKNLTRRMIKNKEIVHMDYLCAKRLEKEYLINKDLAPVIPLAMPINEMDNDRVSYVYGMRNKTILTIARAEYPFKGYVIGLISMFEKIVQMYENVSLVIIGDGPDFDKLKETVHNSSAKSKIQLLGSIPYKNLKEWFEISTVYIGMGTTVLDAANHGVVAFPIGSYTYECKGYDYYYKDGMNLGGLYGEADIMELVLEVITMPKKEYLQIIQKQYEEIKRCYDINSIMEKVCVLENNDNLSTLKNFEEKSIRLGKKIYNLLRRKR